MNTRRVPKRAFAGVLLVPVVAALLVAVAFASLRLPAVERFAVARVNALLSDLFEGRIVLEHVREVGLSGARLDGHVLDPSGRRVITLRDARARLDWPGLVWDAVRGADPLVVDIDEVAIHDAVVHYVEGKDGAPTLAAAFTPRPSPEPPSPEPASETKVRLRSARIDHAWVHGAASGVLIDADLKAFTGDVGVDARGWAVHVRGTDVVTRNLLNGVDPRGRFQGSVSGSLASEGPPDATARFDGRVAGTAFDAEAALRGGRLEARAHAPDVAPAVVARWVPGVTPRDASRVSVTARGALPELEVTAEIGSGPATARVDGRYTGRKVTARVVTSDVDVSRLVEGSVKTDLDAVVTADADVEGDGRVKGRYTAKLHGATVDGQRVPDLDVAGTASLDVPTWALRGEADVDEPGAPTHVLYEGSGNGGSSEIVVDVDTDLQKPPRLVALAGVTTSGRLHAMGRLRPERGEFTAKVEAKLGATTASGVSAHELTLDAAATGAPSNPTVDVKATARALNLPGRAFDRATVRANGKLARARVEAELAAKAAEIRLYANVSGTPALVVDDPAITLVDSKGVVRVTTKRIALNGRRIRVDGLTLDGAGHAEASLVYDGGLRRAQLETKDLDLGRLLTLAELPGPVPDARVSVTASYAEGKDGPAAIVRGEVRDIEFERVHGGAASVDLTLSNRVVSGSLGARLGRGASAKLTLEDVTFDGPLERPRLDTARGITTLDVNVDLQSLHPLLTLESIPVEEAKGRLEGKLVVQRDGPSLVPRATLRLATRGLELVGKRPHAGDVNTAREAVDAMPWVLQGLDFDVEAEGGGAQHDLSLHARLRDEKALLATVDGSVELPEGAHTVEQLASRWQAARGKVLARMEPRRFRRLPELVRPRAVSGTVSFTALAEGTPKDPHVNLTAKLDRFGAAGQRLVEEESARVDVSIGADYRRSGSSLKIGVTHGGRAAADLSAAFRGDVARLAEALKSGPSPIEGDVDLRLDRFPVEVIAPAKNRQVGGLLSGSLAVTGLGRDARAQGKLEASPLELGQTKLDGLTLSVDTKGERIEAKALARGDGGSLEARATSKFVWKDALVPAMDPNLEGHLTARRFRLAAISPFLASVVSEVDGRLDAEIDAKLTDGVPSLDGHAELDSGVVSIPQVGQQMSDIRGKVVLSPRQARLTDFHARGETGALSAEATVDFADRFQVAAARAEVNIAEDDKLPITLEGATIGDAWGKVVVALKQDPETRRNRVQISVPDLHVELPETGSADVQPLDADPHVRIGAVRTDGEFVIVPTQPLESKPEPSGGEPTVTTVEIELGKIALRRGAEVRIQLTGKLKAEIAEETTLTGQITAAGGMLDVQGKRFEIERAVVTFTGESPPNPTIVAVARWDAPGYRVYAEYTGTAKKAKLTLRSDPPLPTDQVFSLLLFGTPDGSFGSTKGGNSKTRAADVVGGTAAKGINRALSDLTDLDVQARVDTSTGVARPELVFQLSRRVAARITRAIGDPLAGTIPDRTFLSFEFRIRAHWLLSTLMGDRGATGLDLVWRVRY